MKNIFKYYLILLWLFAACIASAQNKAMIFQHLSTKEGLSQNTVKGIFQDKTGFIWIATNEGLNRYDGYDLKVFRSKVNDSTSLSSDIVAHITEDANQNLWVSTFGEGVNLFDRKTEKFRHFKHTDGDENTLTDNFILNVTIDDAGNIWVVSQNGLSKIIPIVNKEGEKDYEVFRLKESIPSSYRSFIFKDNIGRLWLSSSKGLAQVIIEKGLIEPKFNYFKLKGREDELILDMVQNEKGQYFMATFSAVYTFFPDDIDSVQRVITPTLVDYVSSNHMAIDNFGDLWLAGNGLYRYRKNQSNQRFEQIEKYRYSSDDPNGLSSNQLNRILADQTGNIWLGSEFSGVDKVSPYKNKFRLFTHASIKDNLRTQHIRAVLEDSKGNVWIGSETDGLIRLIPSSEGSSHFKDSQCFFNGSSIAKQASHPIYSICEIETDEGNFILVYLPFKGLRKIKVPDRSEMISATDFVTIDNLKTTYNPMTIYQSRSGHVWIGTYNDGLVRLSPNLDEPVTFIHNIDQPNSISNNIVRSITEDKEGNLWVGTAAGLNKVLKNNIDNEKLTFQQYLHDESDSSSLSHNYILPVFSSSTGEIWVGTFGGGVNRMVKGESGKEEFVHFDEESGFANDVVKSIIEDENGMLWMGTNKGLTRLNPSTAEVTNYGVNDGLQDSEFGELASFKRRNGEIVFGGRNGFNTFYLHEVDSKKNKLKATPVITEFQLFYKPVKIGEKINQRVILAESISGVEEVNLSYKESTFTLKFSALHYVSSMDNKFRFQLEGFDESPRTTSGSWRYASYTNVPPGDYTFTLNACNNDGLWSDEPTKLRITITPPFWRTIWFRIAAVALGIFLVWLIFQLRLRFLLKQQLRLKELVKLSTRELKVKNKELGKKIVEINAKNDLLHANEVEMMAQNEEILTQNERLSEQNEQIFEQNDALEKVKNKLKDANDLLEKKVEERTHELNETVRKLDKTVVELDRFVYSASHDLSAPLKSVLGLVGLALNENRDLNIGEYLSHIKSSIEKLDGVITSLAAYSRNSKAKIELKKINLFQKVEEVINLLSFYPNGHKIYFRNNIDPDCQVHTDPHRLDVVLSNLIANGIKYAKTRDTEESFVQMDWYDNNENVEIHITDNGIGINPEDMDNIFKMFFRASYLSKGSGLGLYIVKETLQKLGGSIEVKSQLGEGTTFILQLPKSAASTEM